MAAGNLAMERAKQYKGNNLTSCVVSAALIASLGGFVFGYLGIFGVLRMEDIFYDLFENAADNRNPRDYDYCQYGSRFGFAAYSGPVYLLGSLAALLAYPFTTKYGRRKIIIFSGVFLLIGSITGLFLYTTYAGLPGIGIGFGNQAIMLYLSEMAPPRFRGSFITLYQVTTAIGILVGNVIDKDSGRLGWQAIILGMVFPVLMALLLILGARFYLPETPSSLAERGMAEKARQVLEKIRGTDDVDTEFQDITAAAEYAKEKRGASFRAAGNIFRQSNRPHLVMAVLMPVFQNLTGIVFVFVYAPLLFRSMGTDFNHNELYSAAINGAILIVSSLMCSATVDRFGRKALLISGGVLMVLSQVTIAILLGSDLLSDQLTTKGLSKVLTVLIGVFVMAYGWSWGPLGWTIPSEMFTLETRSVGQSIAVSLNLLLAYLVLQFFVPLLCAFKFGLFLFFAGWIVVMTIFVCLFLPETKGVGIEDMGSLWSNHWFWIRYVGPKTGTTQLEQV